MRQLINEKMEQYIMEIKSNKIHKKRFEYDLLSIMSKIWPTFSTSDDLITIGDFKGAINIGYIKKQFGSFSAYEDYENIYI